MRQRCSDIYRIIRNRIALCHPTNSRRTRELESILRSSIVGLILLSAAYTFAYQNYRRVRIIVETRGNSEAIARITVFTKITNRSFLFEHSIEAKEANLPDSILDLVVFIAVFIEINRHWSHGVGFNVIYCNNMPSKRYTSYWLNEARPLIVDPLLLQGCPETSHR